MLHREGLRLSGIPLPLDRQHSTHVEAIHLVVNDWYGGVEQPQLALPPPVGNRQPMIPSDRSNVAIAFIQY
jgi:hypothetical protein